jgi:hypothetical protein
MPLADADMCGRIRDNAAIIAEGAEANALAISQREEAAARAIQLQHVAHRIRDALEALNKQYLLQRSSTGSILYELDQKMDQMYIHLGLTDDQEAKVDTTVKKAVAEALELFEQGIDFEGEFSSIFTELNKIS